jgi:hypothetical protein
VSSPDAKNTAQSHRIKTPMMLSRFACPQPAISHLVRIAAITRRLDLRGFKTVYLKTRQFVKPLAFATSTIIFSEGWSKAQCSNLGSSPNLFTVFGFECFNWRLHFQCKSRPSLFFGGYNLR